MMGSASSAAVMERLGVEEQSFRALGLLPLIHVAWADGKIQLSERLLIRSFAKQKGWLGDRVEALLDGWLRNRLSDSDFVEGLSVFVELASKRQGLGNSIPDGTLGAIMMASREVAEASGGLFGLKSPICHEEEQALQRVADGLGIAQGHSWREVIALLEAEPADSESPRMTGRFLLGNAKEMGDDPLGLLLDAWRRFGDVVRVDIGPTFFYLVVHPDAVKRVLVDNSRNYVRDHINEEFKRTFGEGLFTSEGAQWLERRRLVQSGLHVHKIHAMAATMAEVAAEAIAALRPRANTGQPVDMAEEMSTLALRIASRALFNVDTAKDAAVFRTALPIVLDEMTERYASPIKLPEFLPTPGNRRVREALDAMDRVVYRVIEERRTSANSPDDLLSVLMDLRNEDTGEPLSDEQLRNELLLILFAGHETTAYGMAWTLYYLSKYPAVAREVRAELSRVLGERLPTPADIPALARLGAVIQESMRLRPPVWLVTRRTVSEDSLSGHSVSPGASVLISPYLIHRHPQFWTNPEGFDPDRFIGGADAQRHPMAFMPFGGGPRKCVGTMFAMMEMPIVLAAVLSAYELHLAPGFKPEPHPTLTLRMRDGCWMTLVDNR